MGDYKNKRQHKKMLLEALKKTFGNISKACELAGISRAVYYQYYNSDKKFKESADEMPEFRKDFVENKLMKLINEGNVVATIFFLKTQAKDRGYEEGSKVQLIGDSNNPLVTQVLTLKNSSDEELDRIINDLEVCSQEKQKY